MIKELTRNNHPKVFDKIDGEGWWSLEIDAIKDHRRGSTFYVNWIIELDERLFPENKEFHGTWMTNEFVWSDFDYDKHDIDTLTRVEQKIRMVEVKEWVEVV